MCDGRSSILHYGPLIETYNQYAPRPNGQNPECVAKQKQYPLVGKTLNCRPRDCEFDSPSLQLKFT